ncbi:isoflavone reductase [Thozetella sp. PMI_491]|nr:isoflavone reductase [Thozetella sp. PMI_491]
MAIKNVAVIGASGSVGKEVVKALLAAGFNVTAVTRESSTSTFPSGVAVRKADEASVPSLTAAFAGQDAVVSTVGTVAALSSQNPIADAAVAAGVKRLIPSEFGHNTRTNPDPTLSAMISGKKVAMDYVMEKAKENPSLTYTGITTSLFFDWGLDYGSLGINPKDKTARIMDSGDEPFSATSLPYVGKAVVAVLQHEAETANKYLEVVELTTTQNQLLKAFEEETGTKFDVTRVSTADIEKDGREKLAKGDHSAFLNFLTIFNFRDGQNHALKEEQMSNKLLGLPHTDLRAAVRDYLQSRSA